MKRFVLALILTCLATHANASDGPRLLQNGDYTCKVSKEYKMRPCKVFDEGKVQMLSLRGVEHLLQLEGRIFPNDFVGKSNTIFVEAIATEDKPYLCTVSDPAAFQACKSQRVMITLKKKGNLWVGSFPIKHYWDAYVGEGSDRRVEGHTITVEELSFALQIPKPTSKPKSKKSE